MTFVDRYWEWRWRRALKASLRSRERAREPALVFEVLMERRGVSRRPGYREQEPPTGDATVAAARSEHRAGFGLLPATSRGPRTFEQDGPDRSPERRTEAGERIGATSSSGYATILAAIDGSRSSAEAGWQAVRLAEDLQAELFVLGFSNANLVARARTHRLMTYRPMVLAVLERDSRSVSRQVEELAAERGVKCRGGFALSRRPSRAIVEAAEEVGADCIVIGSPGTSAVDRLLDRAIGGVYDQVLREAKCPVLSVR